MIGATVKSSPTKKIDITPRVDTIRSREPENETVGTLDNKEENSVKPATTERRIVSMKV